jgi:hypothetical protein
LSKVKLDPTTWLSPCSARQYRPSVLSPLWLACYDYSEAVGFLGLRTYAVSDGQPKVFHFDIARVRSIGSIETLSRQSAIYCCGKHCKTSPSLNLNRGWTGPVAHESIVLPGNWSFLSPALPGAGFAPCEPDFRVITAVSQRRGVVVLHIVDRLSLKTPLHMLTATAVRTVSAITICRCPAASRPPLRHGSQEPGRTGCPPTVTSCTVPGRLCGTSAAALLSAAPKCDR